MQRYKSGTPPQGITSLRIEVMRLPPGLSHPKCAPWHGHPMVNILSPAVVTTQWCRYGKQSEQLRRYVMLKGIKENMLQGKKIRLRIVTHADLELIEAWANDVRVHSEYGDFGLRRSGGFEQAFADDGLLGARLGELMIVLPNDEVVGLVSYHRVGYGPNG